APQQRLGMLALVAVLGAQDRRHAVAADGQGGLVAPLGALALALLGGPAADRAATLTPLCEGEHPSALGVVPLDLGARLDEPALVVVDVEGARLPAREPLVGET